MQIHQYYMSQKKITIGLSASRPSKVLNESTYAFCPISYEDMWIFVKNVKGPFCPSFDKLPAHNKMVGHCFVMQYIVLKDQFFLLVFILGYLPWKYLLASAIPLCDKWQTYDPTCYRCLWYGVKIKPWKIALQKIHIFPLGSHSISMFFPPKLLKSQAGYRPHKCQENPVKSINVECIQQN